MFSHLSEICVFSYTVSVHCFFKNYFYLNKVGKGKRKIQTQCKWLKNDHNNLQMAITCVQHTLKHVHDKCIQCPCPLK